MNPIQDAINLAGNISIFARQIGVTPQAVCFWRDGKRQIPADKCPLIEQVTAGAVSCERLRPDVAWSVIRNMPELAQAQPAPLNLAHSTQERREDLDCRDDDRRALQQRATDERRAV